MSEVPHHAQNKGSLWEREALVEEPLIFITPGSSSHEGYFPSQDRQQSIDQTQLRSARPSRTRSKNDEAMEMARELSLIDIEDPQAQHPQLLAALQSLVVGPPVKVVTDIPSSRSLHLEEYPLSRCPDHHRSPSPANRRRTSLSSNVRKRVCEDCNELGADLFLCILCNATLCPKCWDGVLAHKLGRLGPDSIPHEKTYHDIADKIKDSLELKVSEEKQVDLHLQDESTTWFGVGKDHMNDLVFQDSGRYASLMAECSSSRRGNRYPCLVSFVGQTGAGKSTLIKMLIELRHQGRKGPVPVVGSPDLSIPTSGDVHLYSDPETTLSDHPVLYADCEGLEGGEHEPAAAMARHKCQASNEQGNNEKRIMKKIRKKHHSSQREIRWANTDKKRSREFLVTHLYPRLLYTFSDVVVFVLKNPRTIENVVERLIEWAAAALEKSTNQPVLPHVIIALNASENSLEDAQWEVDCATSKLMASIGEALSKPNLKEYARSRSTSTRFINNAEDLLLSYYCSVRVVRIPTRGRPQLVSDQVEKLYQEILQNCGQSRKVKQKVRMLFDADELQPYLQLAFDHFANTLEVPFDFIKAYLLRNPIPADFGGNITKLAIRIMHNWENKLNANDIFKELSPMHAGSKKNRNHKRI